MITLEPLSYDRFLARKTALAPERGPGVDSGAIHKILKPHQRDLVEWMVRGGRRACFAAFGLGKTMVQLETVRLTVEHAGGRGLIIAPLGVRQEFFADAERLGIDLRFIRRIEEAEAEGIYLTNYETVRDGKLDPHHFTAVSLDEAACLRGFGGTKTFREFMAKIAGDDRSGEALPEVPYRYVATATPSPNEYIEILAYAAFLGIMDVSQAKTRFFRRDSTKADKLTLHPHKEEEFWSWVASWAVFVQKPSDLGHSDEGYDLPPLKVVWHELPTDHTDAGSERDGQVRLLRDASLGITQAAREKRDSLPARVAKMREILDAEPEEHWLLWHDLEAERRAIEEAVPEAVSVYGAQDLDERERAIMDFSAGRLQYLAGKPVMVGSGCNFQRHCARAIYLGIGFKFNDWIQSVHRLQRFLQSRAVELHLIYTEAERGIREVLERKWRQHEVMVEKMTGLIREHGLAAAAAHGTLRRTLGVQRREASGPGWRMVHEDAVRETARMESDSVDLMVTSIPFSTQYEYSPSYADLGHTIDNDHFWQHMDYLTPELLRVLKPGRVLAVHVKDRITPGGINGYGFQTVHPFSDEAIAHYRSHGFAFLARRTIVTDVVRENNQTYRLGWTEQCKDGTRMGAGVPEYLLLFRKPPTDRSNGYADDPVVKPKPRELDGRMVPGTGYSRARWQTDAHGFWRSSGDRLISAEDLAGLPHDQVFKRFRSESLSEVYDYERHVELGEELEARGRLPVKFMLLQPQSWSEHAWTDVTRMRTLNMLQERKGQEQHLCLARGSLVLTREHGYIPIQEVAVGDRVLTHRGRWRPVLAVRCTGEREAVTVRAHGVPGLTLTADHKLWLRKSEWVRQRDGAERAVPDWIPAGESLGGYVNLKLPPVEVPAECDALRWWIVGRWLADGHVGTRGDLFISCGSHEVEGLIERLGPYAGTTGHYSTVYQVRLRDRGRSLRPIVSRCGRGADAKRLPAEAFTLPINQARALLGGYLSGDGHFVAARHRWMATSVSRELLLGLAVLVQRVHGSIASVYPGRLPRQSVIEGRAVACKQEWMLSFDLPAETQRKRPFILDDGAWKRVRSVESAGRVETWNLRVAEDESYTTEGCIVKNCPLQFDIVNRLITQHSEPGELVYDPFAGLGTVPYCAVELGRQGLGVELHSGYWADAVTYLEIAAQDVATPTLFDLLEVEEAVHAP